MIRTFLFITLILVFFGCLDEKKSSSMGFTKINGDISGVHFANTIIENDTLNYFNFPYLYLGGGVSIGDINNDGLPDIYFTGNLVSNRLYLNKGNLHFEDITEKAGVSGDNRWYTGSTMADVNNDGFLDIYVSVSQYSSDGANQLFINNGNNTFSEKAEDFGIADKSTSIQSTFFDYNNDGLLDLFVANYPIVMVSMGNEYYNEKMQTNKHEDSGHLYKNNGDGSFTDVSETAGVQNFGMTLGLIAVDFNDDGHKDLYLSNDFNVPDYWYQNNGDGTFSEISQKATRHTAMFGMGIDAADFNNDGLTDLMQVDMTAEDHKRSKTNMATMSPKTFYQAVKFGFHHQYMQNALQMNNGIDQEGIPILSDISRYSGVATTDWSWGALMGDYDNDGLKDIFISNGVKRDVNNNDVNTLYNDGSPFGKAQKRDFRLMPSTPISNYAFKNEGDFKFSKTSTLWGLDKKGFSNGFAHADLDNDGDLDLVISNVDEPASLYINEADKIQNGYLQVRLRGPKENPFGLGAKVILKIGDIEQKQELTLTRGYQSSVAPLLHFGLGNKQKIDELKIFWPDGKQQIVTDLIPNQIKEFHYSDAKAATKETIKVSSRFQDITIRSGIDFKHKEDVFDDFLFEPLLPHRNSRLGPALTVGDVNNDGLDDFFVGNAAKSSAVLYLQNNNLTFSVTEGPWSQDNQFEDTGALLFDADNDNDLDLYVVNGGNDKLLSESYYQDRLYLNTKDGFVKSTASLPTITASGLKVIAGDYDDDGDLDLFVGGRVVPGKYPNPAESYILRNDGGKDTNLRFTNVTLELAPQLGTAGLVTSAIWDDFNTDGKLDLIITGEWMPLRFFKNTGTDFEEVTEELGFADKKGWWYNMQKLDFDNDGDMDYLVGNLGLNHKYKASKDKPFEIYANDFDENGTTDIVLSYEKNGLKLPLRGRECSSQQVPAIKKRFETFESFANADLNDIYGKNMLKKSLHYTSNTFAHFWIENKGNGSFEMTPLPHRAQFSSINAFEIFNYDDDAYPDVLLGGNLYQSEVETPRNDASIGLILKGNTQNPQIVPPASSHLFIEGEIKSILKIKLGKEKNEAFLFALNNDNLKLVTLKKP